MVYRGKASKGCANCRNRATKCDLAHPSCSQCIRAGRECAGYRDQLSLLFCDQSEDARAKVLTRQRKAKSSPTTRSSNISEEPHPNFENSQSPDGLSTLYPQFGPQLDEFAKCFFFANYAVNGNSYCTYTECVRRLWDQTPASGSLSAALSAVGTLGIAQSTCSKDLRSKARGKYGTALSMVNRALKDPTKQFEDETLASIILLGLYETIGCDSQRSMQSHYKHLDGAIALVELRGEKQYGTEVGMELFADLRSQIKGSPVPKCMQQWPPNLWRALQPDQFYRYHLADIISQLCSVRALFRDGSITDTPNVLERCKSLDEQLAFWSKSVPNSMSHSTVFLDTSPEEVCEGYYHVYGDLFRAYLWNSYRSARIVMNQLMMAFLNSREDDESSLKSLELTAQYQKSVSIIRELTSDVLASVPFHLGFHLSGEISPPAIGGLLLIWNLYKVAGIDMSAGRIRDWAIGRLHCVGKTMGIQQAHALALALQDERSGESQHPHYMSAVPKDPIHPC